MNSLLSSWTPRLLSVLRIVSALMFMMHGTQKLLAFPVPRANPTVLWSLSGVAGVLELCGGLLLLLGLFIRPVAFVLSGLMAFAYFLAHAPIAFWPIVNRGGRRCTPSCSSTFPPQGAGRGVSTGGCDTSEELARSLGSEQR